MTEHLYYSRRRCLYFRVERVLFRLFVFLCPLRRPPAEVGSSSPAVAAAAGAAGARVNTSTKSDIQTVGPKARIGPVIGLTTPTQSLQKGVPLANRERKQPRQLLWPQGSVTASFSLAA